MTDIPQSGETLRANNSFENLGGKGINTAVATQRLGGNVSLMGYTGDDKYSDEIV